ncbi:MAG TPA: ABC transporter substrate-binding protein [Acetobacteraceae bacterium]|nr:ABC transporter substrate-binding protein [Acetobacteraceae bacterium]
MENMIGKRVALALAGAIAWCGAAAAQMGAQPAQAAGEPLRIGLLLDMSGLYADLTGPGSETAAKMAAEDFGGRVLGRPIEVVAADHSNRADIASARAREWFGPGRVTALMDVVGSSAALAVQEVGRNANRIVVLNAPASTRIINENCSPTSVLYTYTTYAIAQTVGRAAVAQGGRSWYFIAADYAFGHGMVQDASAVVRAAGGTVLGSTRHPLGTSEFSNFLLQAQSSRADVVALANAGSDTINAVKQAREFGLGRGRQRLAALVVMITDIHSLGLDAAQRLLLSESFYWDMNEETRAWSRRFFARIGRMPTMLQAGTYSSTVHYLKAVQAAGTDEAGAVMQVMRSTPVNDFFARNGRIREDGLMVHDMHLFQVKTPAESTAPWDYYKLVATVPGGEAFPSLADSTCPLVRR